MAAFRKRYVLPLRRAWRRGVFRTLRAVARVLAPHPRATRAVGRFFAWLNYTLRPGERRRDLTNLRVALPGQPDADLRHIARESLVDASVGALEFLQRVDDVIPTAQFLGQVTVHGREHLDTALAGGRGVLAVGLHLGHFGKVPLWLAQAGYPVALVIREARQVPPGYYIAALERLGIEAIRIEREQAAAPRVLDALRGGRVVMIYLDQGVKNDGGIEIDFLGKRVPMPAGPLVLARRARAPIVPVFLHPALHEIVVHPALAAPAGALREDDPTLHALYRLAEAEIRAHPAYWQWRYRRWGRD